MRVRGRTTFSHSACSRRRPISLFSRLIFISYVQVHQKSKGSRSGTDSSLSPPSSASSSPAPRFSSVSTVNSPRALMSSPLHPGVGGPHSNPHPHGYPAPGPYNFASPPGSQGRPRFSAELSGQYSPYPSPSTMPHSNMPGHQNPSFNYNLAPLQRHGNVHQPYASSSRTPAPPHYPWATYPAQPSTPGNPTDAPVQWNPSQPPSSEFSELFQPPGY